MHISRRLTRASKTEADARRVVAEIATLASERGQVVAATGVDDEAHRDLLLEAGCNLATGDLYGKAEPAESID